ncbi:hypothetical protein GLP20_18615 [Photobacterium carnosum]|nr:hypothetical protein [Photobacterium carnosum]
MMTNDQILIDEIINAEFNENKGSFLKVDDFFEFYSASQVLDEYDLTDDDIESGLCGKSLDGGADSIYLFINGNLIHDDSLDDPEFANVYKRNNVDIEFVIIQSKNKRSFSEDPILKLSRLSNNLLQLNFDINEYKNRYNEHVISKFLLFNNVRLVLATKNPNIKVEYFYISKGENVHENVNRQIMDLKKDVAKLLRDSQIKFKTIGSSQLVDLYRRKPNDVFRLKLAENPLSTKGKVFIALVNLSEYFKFISADGELIRHIFEANVRDYQGSTNVNQNIQETLENRWLKEDFWWLNNGITILASDVSAPGGNELIINNPEIVNGLQTSNEIFKYFKQNVIEKEERHLLVRVIVPEDEESRDKIIKATNSQTTIPHASLRATDSIHRDIEDYFKPRGLYYDRRKNFYKNNGKKPAEIVSLAFLAQCVTAITMQKPNFSRARPSTLLLDDVHYNKLYSKENSVDAYYHAAVIGKKVEEYLKHKEMETADRGNIKFHIIYVVSVLLVQHINPNFSSLKKINLKSINDVIVKQAFDIVLELYQQMGAGNKLSKGTPFIDKLIIKLNDFVKDNAIA